MTDNTLLAINIPPAPPTRRSNRSANLLTKIFSLAALTLLATTVFATDIVNDTWRDTNSNTPASPIYSEYGVDGDSDGNLESAWFTTSTLGITDDAVPGGDQLLHATVSPTGSASVTTYFTPESTPVTLAATGDKLIVTWQFRPTGMTNTGTGNADMRLAIVDTPGATRITSGAPSNTIYAGYGIFGNMRTNATLCNANSFRLMEWAAPGGANNFLSSSGAWGQIANGASTLFGGFNDGTNYTLVMTFTRTNTDLFVEATMSGAGLGTNGNNYMTVSFNDTTPSSFTFDTFGIRPNTGAVTATNFATSRFKVEFIGGCTPGASYSVTGTATNCPSGTSAVGLAGSDSGVSYQLMQGVTPVGSTVPGTGSAISFGLQSAGTYTVVASNTTSACVGGMAGSAILSEYLNPTVTSNPTPVDATNGVGSSRIFTVGATGSFRAFQWRKNGVNLVNGGNISGATTNSLTLSSLTLGNSGSYDCIVSNTFCVTEAISSAANLTVIQVFGPLFRSIASGDWATLSTWELSTNGTTWFPATEAPSTLSSNITVQTGHTVAVNADVAVDQVTVQSGATVSVQGGNLTINNGAEAVDFDVAGTLEVGTGAGNLDASTAGLRFSSGGQFNWNRAAAPAIPTATWQDGSTCRITQINTGSSALATGIGGQSYYDFIYDTTAGGQVASARCRMNIINNTTVRRDFTINVVDAASASVTIHNAANTVLTVGRDVTFQTQTNSGSANKILLANAAVTGLGIKIGRHFNATGYLDGFGSASTLLEFNGTGTQLLTLPNQPFIITSGSMDWVVNSGSTVMLATNLDGFNSFTNNGTLNLSSYPIVRGTTLVLNSGGTVVGNGTNQLTFTNYVSSLNITSSFNAVVYGGTLSLPGLPTFAGGESFLLFQAAARSGSFSAISPATPGAGQTWNTSLLVSDGILSVDNIGGGPATNPTNIVSVFGGGNVTLSWPTDHLGWTLQTQTNSRSVGLVPATNAWFDVSGSTSVTNVVIPIGSANPTVFYRLRLFVP